MAVDASRPGDQRTGRLGLSSLIRGSNPRSHFLIYTLLFLLLVSSPVYGLTVPLYGTYDFNNKVLTVFWNLPTSYNSYTIKIHRAWYTEQCVEQTALLGTHSLPVTSKSFNVPLDYKDTYLVEIFGETQTVTQRIAYQVFWVQPIGTSFGVSWCMQDSGASSFAWTGYQLYNSVEPSFTFTNYETLNDWKVKTFDKSLQYGTKINYIMTAAAKNFTSLTITESPPSAQMILYVVLPPKPIWAEIGVN